MLDHLDEIESDLSAFHRVDDIAQLDGPRFLRLAAQLPWYEGATRGSLLARFQREAPPPGVTEVNDVAGLPGIDYTMG